MKTFDDIAGITEFRRIYYHHHRMVQVAGTDVWLRVSSKQADAFYREMGGNVKVQIGNMTGAAYISPSDQWMDLVGS